MNEAIKKRIDQVRYGEVPDGYKVTQSGILPMNWRSEQLSRHLHEHTEFSNDVVHYPVVTSSREGLFLQSEYYQQQRFDETRIGYHVVPQGYITYRHMSDDNIFHFNINTFGLKVLVSPEYPVFTVEPSLCSTLLIEYLNSSDRFLYYCRAQKKGSTRTRLYYKNLLKFYMPIPPFPEQQKIAEILTCCDQVISLKKQLLEEKRRQKKWLMQKLLDSDSGVRIAGFENSVWKTFQLRDLGTFAKGTGISNEDCASGEFPCIKYGDIYMTYDVCFCDAVSYTETDIASDSPHVEGGCLLFTGSGEDRLEIGKCTAYMGSTSLAVGGDIIIMKPNARKVNPLFLAYIQFTDALIRQKARVSQGYSIVHLYADDIRKLVVDIPLKLEEQEAIVAILSAADHEIDLLDQEILQWQQKKKSLMQLLLTGIVRVNV